MWGDVNRKGVMVGNTGGGMKQILHCPEVGDQLLVKLIDRAPLLSLRSVDSNELVRVGTSGVETGWRPDDRGRRDVLLISDWGTRGWYTRLLHVSYTKRSGFVVDRGVGGGDAGDDGGRSQGAKVQGFNPESRGRGWVVEDGV